MQKQLILVVTTACAFVLTLGACIKAPLPDASAQVATTPASGVVPGELVTMEAEAEDIMDFAPQENWERIQADTTRLNDAWQVYLPQAATVGAPQSIQSALTDAIAGLQIALQAEDELGIRQAANDASAAVVELFALYNPVIPADIGRLDVLGRQLILDASKSEWTKAEKTLAMTNKVWQRVKPSALAHQGDEAAAEYDVSLATQMDWLQARDLEKLTAEANNGLEIVDTLERVYD